MAPVRDDSQGGSGGNRRPEGVSTSLRGVERSLGENAKDSADERVLISGDALDSIALRARSFPPSTFVPAPRNLMSGRFAATGCYALSDFRGRPRRRLGCSATAEADFGGRPRRRRATFGLSAAAASATDGVARPAPASAPIVPNAPTSACEAAVHPATKPRMYSSPAIESLPHSRSNRQRTAAENVRRGFCSLTPQRGR
jgi:hypothetical protein